MNKASQAPNVPAPRSPAAWPKTEFWRRLSAHRQPMTPIGIAIREQRMLDDPQVRLGVVANRTETLAKHEEAETGNDSDDRDH